jgi:transposase
VIDEAQLKTLDAQQLREVVRSLMDQIQVRDREIAFKQATIDKITHEMAVLKRLKFAAKSEHFSAEQKSLLEEAIDADLEVLQRELEQLAPEAPAEREKRQPKREKLPENLPRREIRHEPASTTCACGCALKRIGEDVAEKLGYQPGVFSVERHIRGKWVCAHCETLVQAPVAPHIIDKGIPTTGLLAQVLVAKFLDHLPLYRQERIFERAGLPIARSTLAQWVGECGAQLQPLVDALRTELLKHDVLHADETPVAMLKPGNGRRIGRTCGATARPATTRPRPSSSTSPRAAPAACTRLPRTTGQRPQPRLARQAGQRRLLGLQAAADHGCDRGGMPRRTPGASSSTYGSTTRAPWPRRRSDTSSSCMTSSARSKTSTRTSDDGSGS